MSGYHRPSNTQPPALRWLCRSDSLTAARPASWRLDGVGDSDVIDCRLAGDAGDSAGALATIWTPGRADRLQRAPRKPAPDAAAPTISAPHLPSNPESMRPFKARIMHPAGAARMQRRSICVSGSHRATIAGPHSAGDEYARRLQFPRVPGELESVERWPANVAIACSSHPMRARSVRHKCRVVCVENCGSSRFGLPFINACSTCIFAYYWWSGRIPNVRYSSA